MKPPKSQTLLSQRTDWYATIRSRIYSCCRWLNCCSRIEETGVGEVKPEASEGYLLAFLDLSKAIVQWLLLLEIAVKGTFLWNGTFFFALHLRPPKGRHNWNIRFGSCPK